MFSRRLATFLLGVWMGCCIFVDLLALEGQRIANRILDIPLAEAKAALAQAGDAPVGPLLHHLAGEQVRATLESWEIAQFVLAAIMLVLLIFTDQRKLLAIAGTALMGLLAVIQHFFVTPDLNVLGRSVDFATETAAAVVRPDIWTLTQAYGVLETLKLIIGGVLASYFFGMESSVKRSKQRRTRSTDDAFSAAAK